MADLEDVTLDGRPLQSLRVADLKAALEERGLSKSGQKNALIKRLKGALMLENLQRTSTTHGGRQPNSHIGEEMSQNSFIKQYLAKQQELLRQRLEREAREAYETNDQEDHADVNNSASCPDSAQVTPAMPETHKPPGPSGGEGLFCGVNEGQGDKNQEANMLVQPASGSVAMRVPAGELLPERGPASGEIAADSDEEDSDDDEEDGDDEDWDSSARRRILREQARAPTVRERSGAPCQPQQQHIPSLLSPQLRQPTPPPSPPPELSFPLPDTPKQSPPSPDVAPPRRSPSTSSSGSSSSGSRSSSPEPKRGAKAERKPGPLTLLARKMESEGAFSRVGWHGADGEGDRQHSSLGESYPGGAPPESPTSAITHTATTAGCIPFSMIPGTTKGITGAHSAHIQVPVSVLKAPAAEERDRAREAELEKEKNAELERLGMLRKLERERELEEERARSLTREREERERALERERVERQQAEEREKALQQERELAIQRERQEREQALAREREAQEIAIELERRRTLEQERLERERKEKERREREELERALEQEREERKKALEKQLEREKALEAQRKERERIERERVLEEERLERERIEKERVLEQKRLEQERVEREKALEQARLEKERIERERLLEQEKLERERVEQERLEKEKAERERALEQERLEKVRVEQERALEQERLERIEREFALEQKRLESERALEKERVEREKALEKERVEREKALEKERVEREKALEKERVEREKALEKERVEREKALEKERLEKERTEQERLARERVAKERALEEERFEEERIEKEKALEQKRLERERIERERALEQERLKMERIEREKALEQERLDRQKKEQERIEREKKIQQDRIERERAVQKEQEEKEKAEREAALEKEIKARPLALEQEKKKNALEPEMLKENALQKEKDNHEKESFRIAEQERESHLPPSKRGREVGLTPLPTPPLSTGPALKSPVEAGEQEGVRAPDAQGEARAAESGAPTPLSPPSQVRKQRFFRDSPLQPQISYIKRPRTFSDTPQPHAALMSSHGSLMERQVERDEPSAEKESLQKDKNQSETGSLVLLKEESAARFASKNEEQGASAKTEHGAKQCGVKAADPNKDSQRGRDAKKEERNRPRSSSNESSSSESDSGSSSSQSSGSSTSSQEKIHAIFRGKREGKPERDPSPVTKKVQDKTSETSFCKINTSAEKSNTTSDTKVHNLLNESSPRRDINRKRKNSNKEEERDNKRSIKETVIADQEKVPDSSEETPKVFSARKISLSSSKSSPGLSCPEGEQDAGATAGRKRRWGSSTAVTAKKPSISITTDSLKSLIPEIKPSLGQEAVVDLHPEEAVLSGAEDEERPDQDLQIRRTVTQVVHSENQENGQKEAKRSRLVELEEDLEEDHEKMKVQEMPMEMYVSKAMETPTANSHAEEINTVTPSDTLIRRSISQQKTGVSITIDDPVRTARQPSPPRGKVSNIVHISNLVRPFTLGQLKELLSRTGTLVDEAFWIDKIKSHCYATYSSSEEAAATRLALHGVKWPQSNPKVLTVDFCQQDEVDFHKGLGAAVRPGAEDQPRGRTLGIPSLLPVRDQWAEREREMERRERARAEREWDRDKIRQFGKPGEEKEGGAQRSRSRERRRKERGKSKEKKADKKDKPAEDPPAKLLDDLFLKTKATPCIYWLPLTEEQYLQREAGRAERKLQRERRRKEELEEVDKREAERKEKVAGNVAGNAAGERSEGEKDKERDKERERERDRGKERERERERENDKRRENHRRLSGSGTGGGQRSRSRSEPRERRR